MKVIVVSLWETVIIWKHSSHIIPLRELLVQPPTLCIITFKHGIWSPFSPDPPFHLSHPTLYKTLHHTAFGRLIFLLQWPPVPLAQDLLSDINTVPSTWISCCHHFLYSPFPPASYSSSIRTPPASSPLWSFPLLVNENYRLQTFTLKILVSKSTVVFIERSYFIFSLFESSYFICMKTVKFKIFIFYFI